MNEEEIYDEIKNKAADIEVPESLSPENVEKKLQGVKQVSTPKKSTFGVLTALAASFAVMLIAGLAAFAVIKHQSAGYEPQNEGVLAENPSGNGAQSQAVAPEMTYEEIGKMINSYNEENNRRYSDMEKGVDYAVPEEVPAAGEESADTAPAPADDSSANGNGESNNFKSMGNSAAGDYSKTDEQVEGVAEGDIVKTDGTYIYTVDNNSMTGYKIRIIKADGKNSEEISSINGSELNCREMYIYDRYLVTLDEPWGNDTIVYAAGGYGTDGANRMDEEVSISIYDISDITSPKEVKKIKVSGRFATSRISDGYLYIFSEKVYPELDYDVKCPENFIPAVDGEIIPEEKIKKAGETETNNYMIMTSVSFADPTKKADALAILGGYATYYVSNKNIYIARPDLSSNSHYWTDSITSLTRVSYKDGMFNKEASAKIRGNILNSYYMHEYNDYFCFVYMRNHSGSNGLCVMDSDLQLQGELEDVAPGEQIKSSYFMGNMAYFVTYRNTDPVFAVDISNAKKPELKSELKIPGFSSYLHSFGEGQLIGIGYGDPNDNGMDSTTKISLFDIENDCDIKEKSKTFVGRESFNAAEGNHKAVFVDEERGLVGFGLTTNKPGTADWMEDHYVVYKQKGEKLTCVLDEKMTGNAKYSNEFKNLRGVRIGETFYICDAKGVIDAYFL